MASMREVGDILSADNFEDSKKCKSTKKRSKKTKREKRDKEKLKIKHQKCRKDDPGCCESSILTQIPMIKKREKKKKVYLNLNEEISPLLTQHKIKSSKHHRRHKDDSHTVDIHKLAVQPALIKKGPMESTVGEYHESLTSVDRKKKRVIFNLVPEEIHPKHQALENPFAGSDAIKTQSSSKDKHTSFCTVRSSNEHCSKLPLKENGFESQSTSEDINSQDMFITQKSFSDLYVDITSSSSTENAAALPVYQHIMSCSTSPSEETTCKQTAETSTQTENFFTPAVATSFRFLIQDTGSMCTEEALDLCLPNRSRQKQGLHQYDGKLAKDLGHPQLKITDVTSDDSDVPLKAKADLTQLKVVQTRLNESFFFKVKGEADFPKPRSPLMKLTRSDEKKSKKKY